MRSLDVFLPALLFYGAVPWAASASQAATFETDLRNGVIALQKHDLALARQDLERAAAAQPSNAVVWAALAETYLRGNDSKSADAAARKAGKLGADNPVVQHALALFWSEAGDARQTITWATADLKHRDSADIHHLLAEAYWAAKEPDKAIAQFRAAAERAPDSEAYASDLGQMQLRHADFAGALASLGAARTRFPHSAQIELAYGVAAYGQRHFQDAVDSFLRVIAIDPTIEQPYVFLAQILDQAGTRMPRVLAAYAAWEGAVPQNPLPWCLHAKALSAAGGDPATIEAELRRSIQLNGNFWQSHFELGLLLAKKREWQAAQTELERSIQLNPRNARAHFELARVYERLGMKERAKEEIAEHERMTAAETGSAIAGSSTAKDISLP